jgi:hypothetical protein
LLPDQSSFIFAIDLAHGCRYIMLRLGENRVFRHGICHYRQTINRTAVVNIHCTRSFLLVLLAVLSYSSYVKAAAQATNRESLHQKAFTISPDQAERLTLEASTGGAHTSPQQSSISRFSTSERWAMVTELKERINEIKGQRRREHG